MIIQQISVLRVEGSGWFTGWRLRVVFRILDKLPCCSARCIIASKLHPSDFGLWCIQMDVFMPWRATLASQRILTFIAQVPTRWIFHLWICGILVDSFRKYIPLNAQLAKKTPLKNQDDVIFFLRGVFPLPPPANPIPPPDISRLPAEQPAFQDIPGSNEIAFWWRLHYKFKILRLNLGLLSHNRDLHFPAASLQGDPQTSKSILKNEVTMGKNTCVWNFSDLIF